MRLKRAARLAIRHLAMNPRSRDIAASSCCASRRARVRILCSVS